MKHLFVVTYGRSGSTILLNLLNTIDGYCIRGENLGVMDHLGAATKTLRSAVAQYGNSERSAHDPWHGIDRADASGFERALADAFVRFVLVPPADARVVGFKEIRYSSDWLSEEEFENAIDLLMNAFDDPRIVFNTRDWHQVANSGWWTKRPQGEVRQIVMTTDERFRRAHARYPEQTFMIDHAEFDGNPDGFSPLLAWLGEAPDKDRVRAVSETRLVHMSKARKVGRLRRTLGRLTGWLGGGA